MTLPLLTSNIFLSALVSFMFLDSVCIYVYICTGLYLSLRLGVCVFLFTMGLCVWKAQHK